MKESFFFQSNPSKGGQQAIKPSKLWVSAVNNLGCKGKFRKKQKTLPQNKKQGKAAHWENTKETQQRRKGAKKGCLLEDPTEELVIGVRGKAQGPLTIIRDNQS